VTSIDRCRVAVVGLLLFLRTLALFRHRPEEILRAMRRPALLAFTPGVL
jgi:hypothetical protein